MEKRFASWSIVAKLHKYLDRKVERDIILADYESRILQQKQMVLASLRTAANTYKYLQRGRPAFEPPLDVFQVVNTESLETEIFVLRSLLSDYTRTRHNRFVSRLAYREYSQRAAVSIAESFLKDFPRTQQSSANSYVDDVNRLLYKELVLKLVHDIMLSPLVLQYGKYSPSRVTQ